MTTRTRTIGQIERDVRFFRLAGIRRIFGAEFMKEHRLSDPVEGPMREVEREGDFLVDLLCDAGLIDAKRTFEPDLRLTVAERDAAANWLGSGLGPDSESKLIGVAPGSKWESKVWHEDRFAKVVDRLIDSHRVVPVIFGGSEDREKGQRLIERWGTGVNAAGELSIRQAAAGLEKCELYLGNDTGTMHLAASAGTPCVAIFSALDLIGRWYPFGSDNEIFRRSVECEGCYSPTCFNRNKCLDLINVDEVYQACVRVLDKQASKRNA
jgi:ADP-heptose:LPS heptosyltransferase